MATVLEYSLPTKLTDRTRTLRDALVERAFTNRASDWFDRNDLPNVAVPPHDQKPVIIRRAMAIEAMLKAMTTPALAKKTGSYQIFPGELLVGVPTMGSNGLGKVFPSYLTADEKRMASIASRTELSVLGHNSADYERLLTKGISGMLAPVKKKIAALKSKPKLEPEEADQLDFWEAAVISCEAVVAYAKEFARLAGEEAAKAADPIRRQELLKIKQICETVPEKPATTFWEALQSILFVHIGLRAGMDQTSFGRLDQVLQPYLKSTVEKDQQDLKKAVELVECFAIKTAWPLNLTTEYLVEQDHTDFGIMLGTRAYYVDQRSNTNNFLQNVVLGGMKSDGTDAANDCTYVILQAFANVNLPTPGLYVRMSNHSPDKLHAAVATAIAATGQVPCILNDDVIIPGLRRALNDGGATLAEAADLAYDYCVDGCWEPILNGKSDWTLNMINGMTILECSLNNGATLDPNPMLLRGGKRSYETMPIERMDEFEDLMNSLQANMNFFVSQGATAMYNYYLLDEFITPAPLLSAFLGKCLDRGRDKSWGGCEFSIGGTILEGLANMVNSLCAIKKWVFEKKAYTLAQVVNAYKFDFTSPSDTAPETQALFDRIKADFFGRSPKYGTNDPEANAMARRVLDFFDEAVRSAKRFADMVYLKDPVGDPAEKKRIQRLRYAAGYYGPALADRLKERFVISFTAGLGTFEIYSLLGQGVAASADRRTNDPLAMNITPTPGTVNPGMVGHVLETMEALDLERFAAGAVLDLCLDVSQEKEPATFVKNVVRSFIANAGHTLSMTLGDESVFQEIYQLSAAAAKMTNREAASALLKPWRHVNVRAGGWQTPFVSMSLPQQKHYAECVVPSKKPAK